MKKATMLKVVIIPLLLTAEQHALFDHIARHMALIISRSIREKSPQKSGGGRQIEGKQQTA